QCRAAKAEQPRQQDEVLPPVRAEQPADRTAADGQIDAVERYGGAEVLGQLLRFDRGVDRHGVVRQAEEKHAFIAGSGPGVWAQTAAAETAVEPHASPL